MTSPSVPNVTNQAALAIAEYFSSITSQATTPLFSAAIEATKPAWKEALISTNLFPSVNSALPSSLVDSSWVATMISNHISATIDLPKSALLASLPTNFWQAAGGASFFEDFAKNLPSPTLPPAVLRNALAFLDEDSTHEGESPELEHVPNVDLKPELHGSRQLDAATRALEHNAVWKSLYASAIIGYERVPRRTRERIKLAVTALFLTYVFCLIMTVKAEHEWVDLMIEDSAPAIALVTVGATIINEASKAKAQSTGRHPIDKKASRKKLPPGEE